MRASIGAILVLFAAACSKDGDDPQDSTSTGTGTGTSISPTEAATSTGSTEATTTDLTSSTTSDVDTTTDTLTGGTSGPETGSETGSDSGMVALTAILMTYCADYKACFPDSRIGSVEECTASFLDTYQYWIDKTTDVPKCIGTMIAWHQCMIDHLCEGAGGESCTTEIQQIPKVCSA